MNHVRKIAQQIWKQYQEIRLSNYGNNLKKAGTNHIQKQRSNNVPLSFLNVRHNYSLNQLFLLCPLASEFTLFLFSNLTHKKIKLMAKNQNLLTIQSFHQMASLVSVKLSSTNFLLWKSQIFPLIRSAQLIHHLEEEAPVATISKGGKEELNPDYAIWLNNDGLLTSWLLGTMNEEALSLVVGCDSAFQIWKCLKEHYLASTKEQELHLKGQLVVKRGGDDESLEDFIRKFKRTCDSLAAIRKPVDDLDKVFHLSRVVGGRYQPYNLAVLSKPPYPTFNQYIAGLQNNERDLQVAEQERKDKVPNYVQAFVAQRGRGQRGRSNGSRYFNSRGRGFVQAGNYRHNVSNHRNPMINNNPIPQQAIPQKFQPKNSTQQGENQCQICGVAGHTALKCWYRFDHAYQSEELPQALATLSLLEDKDQNTYVDTGATDHMTSDTGPSNTGGASQRH
ncbi:hypothetical protein SLEP1_g36431 [Rubroshorea leprosula]|uniref:Retrotransposon gag domain-containing protein n=1 Tax=Rubroshorea leprosula TaxID=152421 RepID=A0AAV5KRS6_9ROSI|nr:hypothetical protein SLEP1_g36431 [Rubroshorea leprosula]